MLRGSGSDPTPISGTYAAAYGVLTSRELAEVALSSEGTLYRRRLHNSRRPTVAGHRLLVAYPAQKGCTYVTAVFVEGLTLGRLRACPSALPWTFVWLTPMFNYLTRYGSPCLSALNILHARQEALKKLRTRRSPLKSLVLVA